MVDVFIKYILNKDKSIDDFFVGAEIYFYQKEFLQLKLKAKFKADSQFDEFEEFEFFINKNQFYTAYFIPLQKFENKIIGQFEFFQDNNDKQKKCFSFEISKKYFKKNFSIKDAEDFIPIQVKPINEPKITIKFNSLKDFRNNIVCPGESVEYFKPLETPMVIDLHLNGDEKISDNSFLEFQLKKAESQFDLALVRNVGKIIFITGKGKGVLKEEIIKLFNQGFYKNKIESIDSGYHPVYEYGAITYNLK